MNRRDLLRCLGATVGSIPFADLRWLTPFEYRQLSQDREILEHIERLRGEAPARCAVKVERGGPRLFLNGKEEFPFFAASSSLLRTARGYRAAGIRFLHPLIGLDHGWIGPQKYDWEWFDIYMANLLALVPDAWFLPRIHFYAPQWWLDAHPDELVQYALPVNEQQHRSGVYHIEGGFNWNALFDTYCASHASELWQKEMTGVLRDFLRHVERSPLRSRIMGYHLSGSMTAEWHYIGSRFLPDYSAPMQRAAGPVPAAEARIRAREGLLRDPLLERDVIEFYRKFHENTAALVAHFAGVVKEETQRRILCGTFFCYLMENVMIQEAGYLAPERILTSPDIDFIASPYSYQRSNVPGNPSWESDVIDAAGNRLGRARGVGGDGGYRPLTASLTRHNKLFISEIDPSTYLEPHRSTEGGSGSETAEGTMRILARDLGSMFATGSGGWLLEFGYVFSFKAGRGWYDDEPIIGEIHRWMELGERRLGYDLSSVAEIAAVYDAKSFFVTQHWKAEEPWEGQGIIITDFFNHWLLNSQARTLHRIGAPIDFLYRFDLKPADAARYKLFFMPNLFYLSAAEVKQLRDLLRGSGATAVWFYAPGYVAPDRLDQKQMESLTGFRFTRIDRPGPMMIDCAIEDGGTKIAMKFGVRKEHFPRFAVVAGDAAVRALGTWTDSDGVALAMRDYDGYTSIYVGSGPLPVEVLRWIAQKSGVRLWSSKPDVVRATRDAVVVVASDSGERTLRLPSPLAPVDGGPAAAEQVVKMEFGDVKAFARRA